MTQLFGTLMSRKNERSTQFSFNWIRWYSFENPLGRMVFIPGKQSNPALSNWMGRTATGQKGNFSLNYYYL